MLSAEITVKALERAKAQGKIRNYGVSNFGPQNLKDFVAAGGRPVTNQVRENCCCLHTAWFGCVAYIKVHVHVHWEIMNSPSYIGHPEPEATGTSVCRRAPLGEFQWKYYCCFVSYCWNSDVICHIYGLSPSKCVCNSDGEPIKLLWKEEDVRSPNVSVLLVRFVPFCRTRWLYNVWLRWWTVSHNT